MYLFLPFINYGINYIDRKIYRNLIIFLFFIFSIYNCFAKIYGSKNYNFLFDGFSYNWLTTLYIIGAYYGKYNNENEFGPIGFVIYFSIYICLSFFSFKFKFLKIKNDITINLFINHLSPIMILQSLSLLILFSRINIENKYLTCIISFITPLNFGVLIIHLRFFKTKVKLMLKLYNFIYKIRHFIFIKYYIISIFIYLICIFIDYIRFLIFKLLRIKKLCILLEKKVPQLFEKIISKLYNL